MATVEDLGKQVKAKYPGQYDDLPDGAVGQKVKAKFPGSYDDFTEVKNAEAKPADDPLNHGFWRSIGDAASGFADTVKRRINSGGEQDYQDLERLAHSSPMTNIGNTLKAAGDVISRPVLKAQRGNYRGAAGDVAAAAGSALLLHKAAGVGAEADSAAQAAAVRDRLGVPPEAAAPAMDPAGLISNVRKMYDVYKTVSRGISPKHLAEKGFEKFLDHIEGELKKPAGPAAPAPPPEAMPAAAAPVDQLHAAFEQARAAAPAPILPEPVAAPSSPQAAPPVQATPTPASPAAEPVNLGASAPNNVPPAKPVPKTTVTARKLAGKLQDWDFTPDEGQAMNEQGWAKLAHQAGVELPTKAMRGNAIFELKKALAGNKTPGELIQTLKDSLVARVQ